MSLSVGFVSALLVGYLLGSISPSVLVSRLVYGRDVREFGSGNAGGTNMVRVFGKRPGLVVGAIDVLKAFTAVRLALLLPIPDPVWATSVAAVTAGFAAIVGHVWPIYAGFRGGKGVATAFGMLLGTFPLIVPVYLAAFLLIIRQTRYVSVGSMGATALVPLMLWFCRIAPLPDPSNALLFASPLLALFVVFTHRSNVRRLLSGTENRRPGSRPEQEVPAAST